MKLLRTPDERFNNLPEYPFMPHYVEIEGAIRIHYVDEGQNDQEIVLMMHGEPSWSYLYRKMIPIVVQAGFRVIAPDLVGFGKSDKPTAQSDYTYQKHVDWMSAWLQALDLKNITLVCQDWGGLIGLRLAAENPERFKRISAANTFLPSGQGKPSDAFLQWQKYAQETPHFNVGKIINGGCVRTLSEAEIAAYDAPFPDDSYKAAARVFPTLVPTAAEDPAVPANLKAWEVFSQWKKPFMTAFSDSDPITRGGDAYFQKIIPGTQGQKHTTIAGGGHFLQEDKGEEWAELIVEFIQNNP
ncbi:MAG: haloalkane dehalogenase [Microscillaceae bacterium]|nr:haloalkane dehalogenase [Microscillaceae bacterium]